MLKATFAFLTLAAVSAASTAVPAHALGNRKDAAAEQVASPAVTGAYAPVNYSLTEAPENILLLDLSNGQRVAIRLMPEWAPEHVARIKQLTEQGFYNHVVFHRVIDGFMAQTGDVQYGKAGGSAQAGMGGSSKPDLAAEFSNLTFDRGVVGMARSADPNSANSQFFIMFAPAPHLDGQYTVVGKVISGMDVVDAIKKGEGGNGEVSSPDRMAKVTVQD